MKRSPSSYAIKIKPIPFTQEAYNEMIEKRTRLIKDSEDVMVRLKVAREMGDLSENGAYRYAKSELGSIRRQLSQLNYLIQYGYTIKKNLTPRYVEVGSTVSMKHAERTISYQIVSTYESDPKQNKLSTESPLGKELIGKEVGDVVCIHAPIGKLEYTLIDIC